MSQIAGRKHQRQNLVCQGGRNIPSLVYVMLSRVTSIDCLFLDEQIDINKITCNPQAPEENNFLNERSIVKAVKEMKIDVFFVNIQSSKNNMNDLEHDIFTSKSNIICLALL